MILKQPCNSQGGTPPPPTQQALEYTGPVDESASFTFIGEFPSLTTFIVSAFAFSSITVRMDTLLSFTCTSTGTDCLYDLSSCTALTTIDVSSNAAQTAFNFTGFAALTSLDMVNCDVLDSITCSSNPVLTSLSANNITLTSLDCHGCTALAVLSSVNKTALVSLNANSCGFASAAVNAVLADLVAAGNSNGTADLAGTGMGAPTGQGLIDKGVLQAAGWTVTTN